MKALILNSGAGRRMGEFTLKNCKCMAEISPGITILDRQLDQLISVGIRDIIITTGPFAGELEEYAKARHQADFTFINNPVYLETNYIYSIFLTREFFADKSEILLMHGDLVFENSVLTDIIASPESAMVTDASLPLPEKDFKAVIEDEFVTKVGIEFFENAVAAQPLYKLTGESWGLWLDEITRFCQRKETSVYAENALNSLNGGARIRPFDIAGRFCGEVDNVEDLESVKGSLQKNI